MLDLAGTPISGVPAMFWKVRCVDLI